ncbi:MAG: hypothetical protein ACLGIJ_12210 [Candidatus Limnocylindria bacterium]
MPWAGDPLAGQTHNRYSYVTNDPLSRTDPSGHCGIDAALDLGFIGVSVGMLVSGPEKDRGTNALALGADVVSLAIPCATGLGMLVRGGRAVDGVVDATKWQPNRAPDFVVSRGGVAYPVPPGATGPVPVINDAGVRTGTAFVGGRGGENGQVSTIRIMDPTPQRGRSPGYPDGYITYENGIGQGVDPYSGRTGRPTDTHFPLGTKP